MAAGTARGGVHAPLRVTVLPRAPGPVGPGP
jgi:hypothetical protein